MIPVGFLLTLLCLGLISTVRAFKPGAFAMPVDLNDHFFSVGPDFSRKNGSLICSLASTQCAQKTAVMYPSNPYPLCITGDFAPTGPRASGMTQNDYQKTMLTTHGKWCWDTPVRYANGVNISGISSLTKLEIIVEPVVPIG